ncbi:unnamed protein product [Periconia digitata]|uniref:Uncharacterized protein n=1 Tax=Periconia digitata TaxID=1303443 RepID=A0A9W4ULW4_9PLEO|nr:unnamed protein product [Periconia digitata]
MSTPSLDAADVYFNLLSPLLENPIDRVRAPRGFLSTYRNAKSAPPESTPRIFLDKGILVLFALHLGRVSDKYKKRLSKFDEQSAQEREAVASKLQGIIPDESVSRFVKSLQNLRSYRKPRTVHLELKGPQEKSCTALEPMETGPAATLTLLSPSPSPSRSLAPLPSTGANSILPPPITGPVGKQPTFLAQWPIPASTDVLEIHSWRTTDAINAILPNHSPEAAAKTKPVYSDNRNDYYHVALAFFPVTSLVEAIQRSKQWKEESTEQEEREEQEESYMKIRTRCLTIGLRKMHSEICTIYAIVDSLYNYSQTTL